MANKTDRASAYVEAAANTLDRPSTVTVDNKQIVLRKPKPTKEAPKPAEDRMIDAVAAYLETLPASAFANATDSEQKNVSDLTSLAFEMPNGQGVIVKVDTNNNNRIISVEPQ